MARGFPVSSIVLRLAMMDGLSGLTGALRFRAMTERVPGSVRPFTVVAIIPFATGVFLGYFVTGIWTPVPEDWWIPASIRVAWQLGGAVLLGLAFLHEGGALRFNAALVPALAIVAVVGSILGFVFCFNPVLDLARGPAVQHGSVSFEERGSGKRARTVLVVREADGDKHEYRSYSPDRIRGQIRACGTQDGLEFTVLRHLEQVLEVRCPGATSPSRDR